MQELDNSTYCNPKNNKILRDNEKNANFIPWQEQTFSKVIEVYVNGDSTLLVWKI